MSQKKKYIYIYAKGILFYFTDFLCILEFFQLLEIILIINFVYVMNAHKKPIEFNLLFF